MDLTKFSNSPIALAIFCAFMYGIAGPIMKSAQNSGATVNGLCFMYGLAFRCVNKAFTLPGGHVSIVTTIIAAYPLISVALSTLFLGEASKVIPWRLITGTLAIIVGAILVSTSTKPIEP